MKLVKWMPARELLPTRWSPARTPSGIFDDEFGRLTEWLWNDAGFHTGGYLPAMDLREEENGYELHVEVPGVREKDLAVEVNDGVLTIRGERGGEEKSSDERYHVRETWQGSFQRSVRIPADVDGKGITATCRDGILTVRLPRAESAKPRRIAVKS